jgi:hypothetical protein
MILSPFWGESCRIKACEGRILAIRRFLVRPGSPASVPGFFIDWTYYVIKSKRMQEKNALDGKVFMT